MAGKEPFSNTKINEQLNLILSTPAFKSSRILSDFLSFVVEQSLAGKGQELKEYTIAIKVLSRHSDFNPQLDSIVRIHAGRLRRALMGYYYETGTNDPIVIEIPKGSYVPTFHSPDRIENPNSNRKTELKRNRPVIAVLPFRNISNDASRDFFAEGLGEQLSTELTRFQDLAVVAYHSSRHVASKTSDIKEVSILLGAKYLLTGSMQSSESNLRVGVQLIMGDTSEQLWAKSFERSNTAFNLFEIQNEIVTSILTAIGGYYGAIFRDIMGVQPTYNPNGIETYDAIFWYYYYQKVSTSEVLQKAINALHVAVKTDPNYALAWAMLGELYVDDKVHEFKKIKNPVQEALKFAMRAASIDPNCQHAYQSMAWIYLFLHDIEASLSAVDQCIAVNPNASDKVGAMGFVLICAGEFDRGFRLLSDSIQQNPYCAWWFNAGFVLYFLYKKEYPKALHWAEKIDMPQLFWDPLLKASVFGHLNRLQQANKNVRLLSQIIPDAGDKVKNIIESFLLSPDLTDEMLAGLKKAGLKSKNQTSVL